MGGCIQCRKQKEQSTKNFSIGDTFSWLDSDCSMEDYHDFQIFDQEIKSKIQQKFYPQKKEKDNKQQEQLLQQFQHQSTNNQNNQNDVLDDNQILLEERQVRNKYEDENECNFVNQEIEQIQQNIAQIIQSNYKIQQISRIKTRKQSFQEIKIAKLSEKNEKKLQRSRSIGKYNDLLPFNQFLYKIFVQDNKQKPQQQIVLENEEQELKTKIDCIPQQQKRLSISDSFVDDDDFIPNKPMVFNSNQQNSKNQQNQKDEKIFIKQQNENLIDGNNNDSDCNEMEYQCFCCQKTFLSIFQLDCIHQYNQRCLINQILNQINNQEKVILCLCQKQINNSTIEQVKYFNNITQFEQEKITQFQQNVN